MAAFLSGCTKVISLEATQLSDCKAVMASAVIQCWSPIRQPVEQCEIVRESPAGCDFAEQALEFGQTLTLTPHMANGVETANWVMFEVMRDEQGRVGKSSTRPDGARYLFPSSKLAVS